METSVKQKEVNKKPSKNLFFSNGFSRAHHHGHPQPWQPTGSFKGEIFKACLQQQAAQSAPTPELDVTAVPQGIGMSIPLA